VKLARIVVVLFKSKFLRATGIAAPKDLLLHKEMRKRKGGKGEESEANDFKRVKVSSIARAR